MTTTAAVLSPCRSYPFQKLVSPHRGRDKEAQLECNISSNELGGHELLCQEPRLMVGTPSGPLLGQPIKLSYREVSLVLYRVSQKNAS